MMRKIYVFVLVAIASTLVSCGIAMYREKASNGIPKEFQVSEYITGIITDYGLNIDPAEDMGEWVAEWVETMEPGDGFQYFIYADADSWDVYLYYPNKQLQVSALNHADVSISTTDSVLQVYVKADEDAIAADMGVDWVIHLSAPARGPWPSRVGLNWNGEQVACDSVSVSS